MGEVNFNLKKAGANGKSLIYLQFQYHGKKLVFSTGHNINPTDWDYYKQRVKKTKTTTKDGLYSLNDLLDSLKSVCNQAYQTESKNGIPTVDMVRRHLHVFMNKHHGDGNSEPGKSTLLALIDRFINNEIKSHGRDKAQSTLDTYKRLRNHLLEYQHIMNVQLDFKDINLKFFYKFVDFCRNRNKYAARIKKFKPGFKLKIDKLANSSINVDITTLKLVMSEAVSLKLTDNLDYGHRNFSVRRDSSESVYLNIEELGRLYQFDLSYNKELEQFRDLFIVGCFVGLRFSDYNTLKFENYEKRGADVFIRKNTKKTNKLVVIPSRPIVLEIFEKYRTNPNWLPPSKSIWMMNRNIKKICRLAGLRDKGRLTTHPGKELWECISSHTARRSFATNSYKTGIKPLEIMKITGHTSQSSFMKYIRVSEEENAEIVLQKMQGIWQNQMITMKGLSSVSN